MAKMKKKGENTCFLFILYDSYKNRAMSQYLLEKFVNTAGKNHLDIYPHNRFNLPRPANNQLHVDINKFMFNMILKLFNKFCESLFANKKLKCNLPFGFEP